MSEHIGKTYEVSQNYDGLPSRGIVGKVIVDDRNQQEMFLALEIPNHNEDFEFMNPEHPQHKMLQIIDGHKGFWFPYFMLYSYKDVRCTLSNKYVPQYKRVTIENKIYSMDSLEALV